MKGRDALREMLGQGKPKDAPAEAQTVRSGAVRAMDLGLQRLSSEAEAAKALRATLAAMEQVLEIDPASIEVSFVTDRIPVEADPEYVGLRAAIEAHGQQVPILVRVHPEDATRYQAAYGHRRLRVAAELGLKVKAIVRKLSDAELVVAQGQENSERRSLSFIERALFAAHLESQNFDRDTMIAALSVDKPELSRLLGVAGALPAKVIMAIGPAPKVGRPRWLELAEHFAVPRAIEAAESAIAAEAFHAADTNQRFRLVLDAVDRKSRPTPPSVGKFKTADGKTVVSVEKAPNRIQVTSRVPAFAAFLETRLPALIREFEDAQVPARTRKKEA